MTIRHPSKQAIRVRAHELYLERGRKLGHEIDDWLQAEYELTQLPIRKLSPDKTTAAHFQKSPLVNLIQTAIFLGENI